MQILCGERALSDVRKKLDENHASAVTFSASETETSKAAERAREEIARLSFELRRERLKTLRLTAEKLESKSRIVEFLAKEETDSAREFADILSEKAEDFAAVLCGEKDEYRYAVISKSGFDLNRLSKKLNAEFFGRGGGRNGIVQGSVRGEREKIERFLTDCLI